MRKKPAHASTLASTFFRLSKRQIWPDDIGKTRSAHKKMGKKALHALAVACPACVTCRHFNTTKASATRTATLLLHRNMSVRNPPTTTETAGGAIRSKEVPGQPEALVVAYRVTRSAQRNGILVRSGPIVDVRTTFPSLRQEVRQE